VAADGIFLAVPVEPRAGIRLAVNDLLDTAGLTTTYGSAVFAEHVPSTTAESVRLAESGGYANVGKTNLHEFAYGVTSENPHFGTVPNPVAPGRIAGGSSGGSAAALAAGLVDAALGTDSGGSIRIPAACCGVVGFKPTYGLVSIDGCFPLAPSFDHVGPMARTVEECAALLEVIAPGFAAAELDSLEEIAVGTAWVDEADPLVSRRAHESAAHFPRSQSLAWPRPEIDALFMREVADVHRELYAENGELYGEEIAMEGKEDPDNRRDFPGGFPGDSRNAFTPGGRTVKEQRMYQWTRDWIRLRAEHSALRRGNLIDLFYDDDAYVFARQDKTETVIIAINRTDQEKLVVIPASTIGLKDGGELSSLIGLTTSARVTNGQATIAIPPKTAVPYAVR